jgi:hypothetical protein
MDCYLPQPNSLKSFTSNIAKCISQSFYWLGSAARTKDSQHGLNTKLTFGILCVTILGQRRKRN